MQTPGEQLRFLNNQLTVDGLFALMTGGEDGDGADTLRRFDYVPMDTLWLLSADDSRRSELGQLVEKMESHRAFGGAGRSLYTRLLPTLGQRAVPVLLQRLRTIIESSDGDYRVGLIGEGLATLAKRKLVDVRPAIESLLQSRSLSIPSFNYQMTPKISLNTRCAISISENLSINGQTRSSDQLGIWSYNINP